MSTSTSNTMVYGSILVGIIATICIAIVSEAQYIGYDSDSDSNSELGKLVRNSAKAQPSQHQQSYNNYHRGVNQQLTAATRNLYNRQQPLQQDQSQFRQQRNFAGSGDSLSGLYQPVGLGSASNGRGSRSEANDDDDGVSSMGPNFGANFDGGENDDEGNSANNDGSNMNLNQAASGYPGQGDYNNNNNNDAGLGFRFDGNGYSSADSDFGPSEGFGNEERRSKSASSPLSSRGFGGDEDAGAPQYGPNSAINAGDSDDERAGYAPEGQADNENDDE